MKHRLLTSLLAMSVMLMLPLTVKAEINGAEQRILNTISGTFTYEGKTYKVKDTYQAQVRAKLDSDGVDMSDAEADSYIDMFYSNIGMGVASGYMEEIVGGEPEPQPTAVPEKTPEPEVHPTAEPEAEQQVVESTPAPAPTSEPAQDSASDSAIKPAIESAIEPSIKPSQEAGAESTSDSLTETHADTSDKADEDTDKESDKESDKEAIVNPEATPEVEAALNAEDTTGVDDDMNGDSDTDIDEQTDAVVDDSENKKSSNRIFLIVGIVAVLAAGIFAITKVILHKSDDE